MKTFKTSLLAPKLFAAFTLLALILGNSPIFLPVAEASTVDSVTICHADASNSNPYITNTPNRSADVNGHDGHDGPVWYDGIVDDLGPNSWGDIIPPFEYLDGTTTMQYDGKNWNTDGQAIWNNDCNIPGPDTVWLELNKLISPAHFAGDLDEEDFSFDITGGSVDETVVHGGMVELPVGTYSITESYNGSDPIGFDPDYWTVYYVGDLCVGDTDLPASEAGSIVVEESDIGKYTESNPGRCNAENQYKPGAVQVNKVVVNATTSPDNFSFTINGGDAIDFESDGSNDIDLPAGDYAIEETSVDGYSVTYSEGCEGTIGNNEVVSCTITNTFIENPVYGCTDPQAENYDPSANIDDGSCVYEGNGPTYLVFGYVWHDENENTIWDGFDDEEATTTEDDLTGWTVEITNGSTTYSTTTDESGYYQFYVTAGTWTITEQLQSGWSKTYPPNGHTVEVVDETLTAAEDHSLFAMLISKLIPTAHAQGPTIYGPYNFGNVYGGGSNGGGGLSCTISANDTSVTSGTIVKLNWTTTGATSAEINNGVGAVDLSGDTEVTISDNDVTYVLTAGSGSDTVTCDVTIRISSTGGGGGGGDDDDDDDNGGSSGSSGGSSRSSGSPQVLGEQVSTIPMGAADTGAGGTSPLTPQDSLNTILSLTGLSLRRDRRTV